jgi:hypothetical protein
MRKLLLTMLVGSGLSIAAFAQGTVEWTLVGSQLIGQTNCTVYSSFTPSGTSPNGGTVGNTAGNTLANNTALGYQGYYYELLVSATASTAPTVPSQLSSWSDTGLWATNGAVSNGRIIQGPAQGVAGNTQATAANWAAGVTENIILVGWSANLGSSWSTVLNELQNWNNYGFANAYFGVSSVGDLASGTANPGVLVFGSGPGQINNAAGNPLQLDVLTTIPEPGTMALAALGVGSMLLFRRKK